MAATILLDAGHGGWHNGAVFEGRREKDDVLALTLAVGRILEDNGLNVLYTRTNDTYISPEERANTANETDADYFVSIHRNASPYFGQYSGAETLVYNRYGAAAQMAAAINRNLEGVGFINQGVNEGKNLIVLNRTQMPALLVEAGFINTPADNYLFDTKFNEIAQAIADGILETTANTVEA
ncbi:MAG: N-acetylmuramoyl-L-alanine amidase [Lachnospiraceae bacterium]|nr:N-acetylmuramoyl-L-alanine amidase [Lachnospiraceae bacterium]